MPSIKETLELVSDPAIKLPYGDSPIKNLQNYLETTRKGTDRGWHPEEASVLQGLKDADYQKVHDTLKEVSLAKLLEYATGSGGTGTTGAVMGANYLIPDKVYDILYVSAKTADVAPIAGDIVSCPGSSLKVDIEKDGYFRAMPFGGGGQTADETLTVKQVTITPGLFGVKPRITNELIEDANFPIFEIHLQRAAQEMGRYSSQLVLQQLLVSTAGDGTVQTGTSATGSTTYFGDIAKVWALVADQKYFANTVITTPRAIGYLVADATVSQYSDTFHTRFMTDLPVEEPGLFKFGDFMGMGMYVLPDMGTGTTYPYGLYQSSKNKTIIFDNKNAMLTVRKRWLKIENYADPVRDLVGAVVTSRQACSSIHNNAVGVLTES